MSKHHLTKVFLILAALGCSPVEKPERASAPKESLNSSANASGGIVGSWEACTAADGGAVRLRSSKGTASFESSGKFTLKMFFYSDSKCKIRYSQKDVDIVAKEFPEEEEEARNLLEPMVLAKGNYVARKIDNSGVGEIDMTVEGETIYGSYKLINDRLYLAKGCEDGEDELGKPCEINGDHPSRRAKEFGEQYLVRSSDDNG